MRTHALFHIDGTLASVAAAAITLEAMDEEEFITIGEFRAKLPGYNIFTPAFAQRLARVAKDLADDDGLHVLPKRDETFWTGGKYKTAPVNLYPEAILEEAYDLLVTYGWARLSQ